MDEDSMPTLEPYHFIYIEDSAQVKAWRESYNWRMTPEGWLRRDKKEIQQPSTPPKNTAPLDFLGQCFDEDEGLWTHCFEFEKDGSIESRDTSFHKVRGTAGDAEIDLDEALGLVANASKAAGAVFICLIEKTIRLSGFFVSNGFFLTCAHFQVTTIDEEEMKKSGSKMTTVCTKRLPYDHDKSAHLVFRDKDRDFAIFCLDKDEQPHTSPLDLDRHFPGVDRLDFHTQLANRRAFAIGYNSSLRMGDFPRARQEVIDNLTTPDKQRRAQAAPAITLDFDKVFRPDRKTLAVGRLHRRPPHKHETTGKHRITGWYGISGAMIACLDNSSSAGAQVQVLGLFSHGVDGNNNQMVLLTTEIVQVIRDTIQSHKMLN